MARKRSGGDEGGGYNWMDTYGDMVTLLLTFFVMLFSMSTIDEKKWQMLVVAFSNGQNTTSDMQQVVMPGNGPNSGKPSPAEGEYDLQVKEQIDLEKERPISLSELYDYLKAYINENNMEGSVNIEKDAADNVTLRFDNNIFFSGDSAVLREASYPILSFMGECLKGLENQILVTRVNGHTASVPVENYPINDWKLSAERATEVIVYFEEKCGMDPTKLMANGWGKNQPRFPNDTEEHRAQNRRVEIMIIGNKIDAGNAEQLYAMMKNMLPGEAMPDPNNGADVLMGDMATSVKAASGENAGSQVQSNAAAQTPTVNSGAGTNAAQSSTASALAQSNAGKPPTGAP